MRETLTKNMPQLLGRGASLDSLIMETLETYKNSNQEQLRSILFLRNLSLAESFGLLPKTGYKSSKIKLITQSPLKIGQAIWHKTLRDLYRRMS